MGRVPKNIFKEYMPLIEEERMKDFLNNLPKVDKTFFDEIFTRQVFMDHQNSILGFNELASGSDIRQYLPVGQLKKLQRDYKQFRLNLISMNDENFEIIKKVERALDKNKIYGTNRLSDFEGAFQYLVDVQKSKGLPNDDIVIMALESDNVLKGCFNKLYKKISELKDHLASVPKNKIGTEEYIMDFVKRNSAIEPEKEAFFNRIESKLLKMGREDIYDQVPYIEFYKNNRYEQMYEKLQKGK